METKECKKCKRVLHLSMFDENRHQCKDCRKAYRKQRRQEHPEIHTAQSIRRQNRQRNWLNSKKAPCVICGESEPVCVDFHHIDPAEKEFTIGKHRSRSRDWLSQEIAKCICLCTNCHRKVHAGLINLQDYI